MRIKALFPLMVLALALAAPGFGQEAAGTLSLSLDECIVKALKDNLGVAIQILGPEISSAGVTRAQEKYIPTLSMSASSRSNENASYSYLDAAESLVNKSLNFTFLNASQALPTGGTFSLDFTGYRSTTNRIGQTINPLFGTTLRFNFSQPLLRNFGFKMARREILVAMNNLGVSEENLKMTLTDTVYNVESAYWNLVYSIENLDLRRQSLQLARDLLEKNQRSVEVGTLAPMEVLSARAEVATREADLIQAETQIQSNEDQLRLLLNISGDEDKRITAVVPKDKPTYVQRTVDLEEALATAIQNRTDLEISRIGLETEKLNLSYARNQNLPDLNLTASLYAPGIDGTRIFYIGSPLDGIIDYTVPGGINGALRQTANFQYPNWNLGLTLSIPLANLISKANLAQARLNMRQAMLELENQKEQIYLEIKNAVRSVVANYKRILAFTTARELSEQKLAAEEEKRRVGMSTNYFVLQFQRDLANARISELNAIISYNVSLAALEKSMGTNLKSKNINLSGIAPGLD
ncbi:MAG: TolC family protein [Acidobacteria bacterium]|nr:TolC family protein [Acidobacteriota bacterium]